MKSVAGGEEANSACVSTAIDTVETPPKRKRPRDPIPVPPWEQNKKPRRAAEAARQLIKEVTTGKDKGVIADANPKPGRQGKGILKRGQSSKFARKANMFAGKALSGNDTVRKTVRWNLPDDVGKTVENADNWEQFKGLIKPHIKEYVGKLHESVQRKLTEKDGLWYRDKCVVVPDVGKLRQQVIAAHHNSLSAGHFGVAKTYYALCKDYWWPTMRHDVETFVHVCHQCQTNKPPNVKPGGLLQPLPVPTRKWESIGMDFIVQLPCTKNGHDSIMVVIDRLSKLAHFIPTTTDISAADVAHLFIQHVAKHHGLPSSIVSDRDTKFTSRFWQAVMEMWGVKSDMTTAFHPQGNAQTERMNRVLEEYLRHFVSPKQDNWDELLPIAEFAINNSYQESIGMTPFYMTYGYNPRSPVTVESVVDTVPAAMEYVQGIDQAVKEAKLLVQKAQQRQKAHADTARRAVKFSVGQEVLLSTENIRLKTPGAQKLLPRFIGPFVIKSQKSLVTYELRLPDTLKVHPVFHVSLLKPYYRSGSYQPPPLPLSVDDIGPLYEVEAVLKYRPRKKQYLVQWKGYGKEHNTWEPESMLNASALQSFWQNATDRDVES
jgi:hypothetical protein